MAEPGWYPDPLGRECARYWDGTEWEGALHPGTPHPDPTTVHEFPEPEQSRRLWPVWVGLGVAVAIAVGSAVFVLTRPTGETPKTAPSTTLTPTVPSPTSSPAEMAAAAVKVSMQRKLDSDPNLKKLGLTVVDVVLVNKSGNEFKGIATVKTSDGVGHDVPVEVTSDKDNTLWETPPGAFVFDTPAPKAPPPPPPPPPAANPGVENFKVCPSGLSGVSSADTSCAFADSVRSAWYSNPGPAVFAYSPVTHQSYLMHCAAAVTDTWPEAKRCAGTNAQGTLLVVYFD